MKEYQKLSFIRKGLLMTLFNGDKQLLSNFGLFFGDGKLNIEHKESPEDYVIRAKSKNYDRTFIVKVQESKYDKRYKSQIVSINER